MLEGKWCCLFQTTSLHNSAKFPTWYKRKACTWVDWKHVYACALTLQVVEPSITLTLWKI